MQEGRLQMYTAQFCMYNVTQHFELIPGKGADKNWIFYIFIVDIIAFSFICSEFWD